MADEGKDIRDDDHNHGPEDTGPGLPQSGPGAADEDAYILTDGEIQDIVDALDNDYEEVVVAALHALSAADIAELLAKLHEEDREKIITKYGSVLPPAVFPELEPALRTMALENMDVHQIAALVDDMDTDDALYLIEDLEPETQREIIRRLSARSRLAIEEGLNFPEDSAGRLMQREFVAIPQFWTVGKTIDYLRAAAYDLPYEFFDIFVVTPANRIVGKIPLNRLVRAQRPVKLESLAIEETNSVPATMDQEEVAQLFRRENLISAPVIDLDGRMIGVITIDDVVDVIDEEAQEDMLKMGGVGQDDLYSAIFSTTFSRFRWLLVNLVTAILASVVISFFDATIEQIVALAILMPIVASMGGNAGTQSFTVVVRALATRQLSSANVWRIVWKETVVGTLNGAVFAVMCGAVAAVWFGSIPLGIIMGAAMIINLFCAGFSGACIPMILNKMGSDPALSSAVFLTTITDVVGFFAFLGLAALFLV